MVRTMQYYDFFKFPGLFSAKKKRAGKVSMHNFKSVQFRRGFCTMFTKTEYNSDFQELDFLTKEDC